MSNAIKIDPTRGFVALPAQILDLEISPGAFRVLTHLCNLANDEGWSWPSLEQLGEKLQRSKASISAYIAELREEGVIETVTQKMASGYNYRLKICVVFWSDWVQIRQKKKIKPVQPTEGSVQNNERPPSGKNNKHKTHTHLSAKRVEMSDDVKKVYDHWVWLTKGQPFRCYREPPSEQLLSRTKQLIAQNPAAPSVDVTAVTNALKDVWAKKKVATSEPQIRDQIQQIIKRSFSHKELSALICVISSSWKGYWSRPPTPKQFQEMVGKAKALDQNTLAIRAIDAHHETWKMRNTPLSKVA